MYNQRQGGAKNKAAKGGEVGGQSMSKEMRDEMMSRLAE